MKLQKIDRWDIGHLPLFFCWLLLAAALVGCSGDKNPLGAVKVTGLVTLDGEPVPWASITFFPKSEGIPVASGRTDEKGEFLLTPVGGVGGEGALAGAYLVYMTKSNLSEEAMYNLGNPKASLTSSAGTNMPAYVAREDFFPKKYTKPQTSGLEATVEKGKKNHFEFECFSE